MAYSMFSPSDVRAMCKAFGFNHTQVKLLRDDLYSELERANLGLRINHCCPSYETLVECISIVDEYFDRQTYREVK